MAILTTVAAAATVSTLRAKVRTLVGDTSSVSALQRFSDLMVDRAIDDTLAHLYMEWASEDPSGFLTSDDLTYTASATSVALTAGREAHQIYRVEDVTTSSDPVLLDYLNPLDAEKFSDSYGWTLKGNAIVLVPVPTSNKTLRIWSLKPFVPVTGAATPTTDQHSLSINHEELITLGAAIRLQEIDDEVPPTRLLRYEQLWQQYLKTIDRYRGPTYVRNSRIIFL